MAAARLHLDAAGVATEAARFAAELPLNAAGVATEAAVAAALEAGDYASPSLRVLAAEKKSHCDLLRDVLRPLPFRTVTVSPTWPSWHGGLLVSMAQRMYAGRDFGDMPVLADALEEAGCTDPDILWHCREEGAVHVRGCWVIDILLGKALRP
jgi:hypothetical protein